MTTSTTTSEPSSITRQSHACYLCGLDEDDPLNYGDLKHCTKNGREIYAHNFCLLFSCNLKQNGSDEEGINGFLLEDIEKEKRRGGMLTCKFCGKKGATAACCNEKCKTSYHYTCAVNQGTNNRCSFIFCDNFTSYCKKHEPKVKIRIVCERSKCTVCLCMIRIDCYRNNSLIQCDHCEQLAHVSCIKKYAKSAGLTHFKCTNCNCSQLGHTTPSMIKCKQDFVRKCQLQGVFIEDKDAEWEYGDDYADHYKDYDRCDADICLCPDGRNHDDFMNKCEPYYIVLCSTCGSSGSHRKCSNIKGADVDKWLCITCKNILQKSLDQPGPSTSKISPIKVSDPEPSTPSYSLSSTPSYTLSSTPSYTLSSTPSYSLSSNLQSSVSNVSTSSESKPDSSKNETAEPSKVARVETVKRQGTKKARSESPRPRSKSAKRHRSGSISSR